LLKSLKSIGLNLGDALVDVVAPPRCMGCLGVDDWLCDRCFSGLKAAVLTCVGCGSEQPRGKICRECRRSMFLTGVVSVGKYESLLLRRGVYWLKFKGIKDVAKPLASLMMARMTIIAPLKQLRQKVALVPVPLHKKRLLERGFNQSLELCDVIGNALKIPVCDVAERTKQTWTQAKLPDDLRNDNVKDAFRIKAGGGVSRPKLIIVDDVITSGSTLDAVAGPLLAAGAKEVWGLTVARG